MPIPPEAAFRGQSAAWAAAQAQIVGALASAGGGAVLVWADSRYDASIVALDAARQATATSREELRAVMDEREDEDLNALGLRCGLGLVGIDIKG